MTEGAAHMLLDSITLENYRCHENLTVDFSERFSVIVGLNGSGKTCLLEGIKESLAGYYFPNVSPCLQGAVVRLKKVEIGRTKLLQSCYPVKVMARGGYQSHEFSWTLERSSEQTPFATHSPGQPGGLMGEGDECPLPLALFYRADRRWSSGPLNLERALAKETRASAYEGWESAHQSLDSMHSWVVAKTLQRFERCSQTGERFDGVDDDELALVNRALSDSFSEFRGLRYDMSDRSIVTSWESADSVVRFDDLSDGQKGVMALITDIARRACLLNPQLGQEAVRQTPGVVLIDELELHLHPAWQRTLTLALKNAFPKIQFIVSSHSPQVLSELRPAEIILLRPGHLDRPRVSYGLDSSQVLEEVMGVESRPHEVQAKLDRLFHLLDSNDLQAAEVELNELRQSAPGLPDLERASALLRRKVAIGR